ncbi:MAG: caspase family protein [Bacteroidota bacterium]
MKKIIILYALTLSVNLKLTTLQAQTIHCFIVADKNDPEIGDAVRKDVAYINALVSFFSLATGYKISDTYIYTSSTSQDIRYTKSSEITSKLLSMDIGPNDIVWFYYSGHGTAASDSDDKFARPAIRNDKYDYLSLSMIQNLIAIHKPSLSIVLGDLCNSFPGSNSGSIRRPLIPFPQGEFFERSDFPDLKKLLMQKGTITSTSSKRGTVSYIQSDGGVFTKLFINALISEVKGSTSPSWHNIFDEIKDELERRKYNPAHFEISLKTNKPPRPEPIIVDTRKSLKLNNACSQEIFLQLQYQNRQGEWIFVDAGRTSPNQEIVLASNADIGNVKFFYYARSTGQRTQIWTGNHLVSQNGKIIKMREGRLFVNPKGDYYFKLTCSSSI